MSQYDDVMNKKAVALRYDENRDIAPVIVASGLGYMAERIVEVANENGVPVYEDNSLATVLTQLDLGTAIPEELYQAIVDIYAYFLRYNPDKVREAEEAREAERRAREEAAAREDEDAEGDGEGDEASAVGIGDAGDEAPAKTSGRAVKTAKAARPAGSARTARPAGAGKTTKPAGKAKAGQASGKTRAAKPQEK